MCAWKEMDDVIFHGFNQDELLNEDLEVLQENIVALELEIAAEEVDEMATPRLLGELK